MDTKKSAASVAAARDRITVQVDLEGWGHDLHGDVLTLHVPTYALGPVIAEEFFTHAKHAYGVNKAQEMVDQIHEFATKLQVLEMLRQRLGV